MPAVNVLSSAEIETVREICGVSSIAEITTKAQAQLFEQNVRTRADIAQWEKFNNKFSSRSGGKFGLKKVPEDALLRICNRVRIRFGYLAVSSLDALNSSSGGSYCSYTPANDYCE